MDCFLVLFHAGDRPADPPGDFSDTSVSLGETAFIVGAQNKTTDEVAEAFKLCADGGPSGIVVKMENYSGCGPANVIEKFAAMRGQ